MRSILCVLALAYIATVAGDCLPSTIGAYYEQQGFQGLPSTFTVQTGETPTVCESVLAAEGVQPCCSDATLQNLQGIGDLYAAIFDTAIAALRNATAQMPSQIINSTVSAELHVILGNKVPNLDTLIDNANSAWNDWRTSIANDIVSCVHTYAYYVSGLICALCSSEATDIVSFDSTTDTITWTLNTQTCTDLGNACYSLILDTSDLAIALYQLFEAIATGEGFSLDEFNIATNVIDGLPTTVDQAKAIVCNETAVGLHQPELIGDLWWNNIAVPQTSRTPASTLMQRVLKPVLRVARKTRTATDNEVVDYSDSAPYNPVAACSSNCDVVTTSGAWSMVPLLTLLFAAVLAVLVC